MALFLFAKNLKGMILFKHYDRDNAFFYCDPPYYSSEYVYQCGFTWDDHLR
ncbi:hypothetical protein [Ruminococcus bromii]|uniref:hypothetical protein n=1 Tax=Ruminococcus bromii TaxID=40518 RepID=UPI00266F06DA|nr:hypothetical protein [Ruminococcus bromii]